MEMEMEVEIWRSGIEEAGEDAIPKRGTLRQNARIQNALRISCFIHSFRTPSISGQQQTSTQGYS